MPRNDKLSMYKTRVICTSGLIDIYYHATNIVSVRNDRSIVLDFGGWDIVTTRRKMNQASRQFNLGYSVFRHKGQTYINSTNDLDPTQSVQYIGYPIVIGANKDYGSIRETENIA